MTFPEKFNCQTDNHRAAVVVFGQRAELRGAVKADATFLKQAGHHSIVDMQVTIEIAIPRLDCAAEWITRGIKQDGIGFGHDG